MKKSTTVEFINKAKEIHGDKYDYSQVEYFDAKTKIKIICPEHGIFEQIPSDHLSGCGCQKCVGRYMDTEYFKLKANKIHNGKYDYSLVEYIDAKIEVKIICPEHGIFEQMPTRHIRGSNCQKCAGQYMDTEYFKEKAAIIHENKYDYSQVDYVNSDAKVKIICPEHGVFEQIASAHLMGSNCPKCGEKYMDTELFKIKATAIHGDRYDYKLVDYVKNNKRVKIICSEHGIFEQTPNVHLSNHGCPNCAKIKIREKLIKPIDNLINEANLKHNYKYDYSLVEYINSKTKVKIICPEHGVFEQRLDYHIKSNGCVKCNSLCHNNESFVNESKKIHGDKYDYSLVEYKGTIKKVKIICPEHGVFEQRPSGHLSGCGCSKCFNNRITTKIFIERAKLIHGDKYDYSLVDYAGSKLNVKIKCLEHGIFEQKPNTHLQGAGCTQCANIKRHNFFLKSLDEFISEAKIIHKNKYDYSLVDYIDGNTKVKIICPKHGIFDQIPNSHLVGAGCPKCRQSRNETKIEGFFIKNNINYISQHKFNECKYINKLIFDFYLPDYNICIEFDGEQHFRAVKRFGGEEKFKIRQTRDSIKNKYCEDNDITLIRIKYNENIEDKLIMINELLKSTELRNSYQ